MAVEADFLVVSYLLDFPQTVAGQRGSWLWANLGANNGGGQTNLHGSKVVMLMCSHDVVGWDGDQDSAEEQ